jgi:hypothetical protein
MSIQIDCQEAALALLAVVKTRCPGAPDLLKIVVKGLLNMMLSGACHDVDTQRKMQDELKQLVNQGPTPIITAILRSTMHSAACIDSSLREGCILDMLIMLSRNICDAATIAKQSMQNRYRSVLATSASQTGFMVAADAARLVRIESFENAAPPWVGAKMDKIEEIALLLCETFRAICMGNLSRESRTEIQQSLEELCETELIDSVYASCVKQYTIDMLTAQAERDAAASGGQGRRSTADDDIYSILAGITTTIQTAPLQSLHPIPLPLHPIPLPLHPIPLPPTQLNKQNTPPISTQSLDRAQGKSFYTKFLESSRYIQRL